MYFRHAGVATSLEWAGKLAEAAGDSVAQVALLNNLALARQRAGQIADARATLIRAIDLLEGEAGTVAELAEMYQVLNTLRLYDRPPKPHEQWDRAYTLDGKVELSAADERKAQRLTG